MSNFVVFCNTILKMFTFSLFQFYTSWGLILFILYALGILTTYQSSIFVILLNITFAGMILTYVHPKEIVVPFINRKIGNNIVKIYNLVFHILPLVLFLLMYNPRIKSDNLYLAVFSLLLYVIIFNPIEIYSYKGNSKNKLIANALIICYLIILGILIIKQKNLF